MAHLITKGVIVLLVVLALLFGAAAVFAYEGFVLPTGPLPVHFYIALGFGVVFTLAVGMGLMALVFYSSRHGYDEPPRLGK